MRFYCPSHKIGFSVSGPSKIVTCSGGHSLSENFPLDRIYGYCHGCSTYWWLEVTNEIKEEIPCPHCDENIGTRYFCSQCKILTFEPTNSTRKNKTQRLTQELAIIRCSYCHSLPNGDLITHFCKSLGLQYLTTRSDCLICGDIIAELDAQEEPTELKAPIEFTQQKTFSQSVQPPQPPPILLTTRITPERIVPEEKHPTLPTHSLPKENPKPLLIEENKKPKKDYTVPIILLLAFFIVSILVGITIYNASNNVLVEVDRALGQNRLEDAVELYLREQKNDPNSPDLIKAQQKIRTGIEPYTNELLDRKYFDSNDPEWKDANSIGKIIKRYDLLHKVFPNDQRIIAKLYYCQGEYNFKQEKFQDALDFFTKSTSIMPNWGLAINGVGKVHMNDHSPFKDVNKALEWYEKAGQSDPNFVWSHVNLANYFVGKRNWTKAEAYIQKALLVHESSKLLINNSPTLLESWDKSNERLTRKRDKILAKSPQATN